MLHACVCMVLNVGPDRLLTLKCVLTPAQPWWTSTSRRVVQWEVSLMPGRLHFHLCRFLVPPFLSPPLFLYPFYSYPLPSCFPLPPLLMLPPLLLLSSFLPCSSCLFVCLFVCLFFSFDVEVCATYNGRGLEGELGENLDILRQK